MMDFLGSLLMAPVNVMARGIQVATSAMMLPLAPFRGPSRPQAWPNDDTLFSLNDEPIASRREMTVQQLQADSPTLHFSPPPPEEPGGSWNDLRAPELAAPDRNEPAWPSGSNPTASANYGENAAPNFSKRIVTMDRDLNDDMLKLVRYNVVCVHREHEAIFPQRDEIVEDRMDDAGFTAWKIAEFMEDVTTNGVPAPAVWRSKPPEGVTITGGMVKNITGEPRKYLRLSYQVVDRYPREKFKYEELQIDVLRQIKEAIPQIVVEK